MKKALNIIKTTFVWLMVLLAVTMMIFTVISCTTFNRNDRSLFGFKMYIVNQQKETFEKFKDCQSELAGLTERDAFRDGFILAVRIMVEAMEGLETVEDI